MGVSENRGTLLGCLLQGNPTIWGTILRVPYFRNPPCVGDVLAHLQSPSLRFKTETMRACGGFPQCGVIRILLFGATFGVPPILSEIPTARRTPTPKHRLGSHARLGSPGAQGSNAVHSILLRSPAQGAGARARTGTRTRTHA